MSLLGRKTFVEKVLEDCSSEQLEAVRTLINTMNQETPVLVSLNPLSSGFISNANKGVSFVSFRLDDLLALTVTGILVYTDHFCGLFGMEGNLSNIAEYDINVANRSYHQVYEHLTAEELRQVCNDILGGGKDSIFNFVDLTTLGDFSIAEKAELNSISNPEILPIVKGLFDSYSADKITVVKLAVDSGEEDQDITVTASDTAVHITMSNAELIQVIAANIFIPAQEHFTIQSYIDGSILTIADAPWPGLTPDLISVLLVVATKAKGSVLIHQKMFESRLFFVDKLIDMGAQIILCDPHRASIIGLGENFHLRPAVMSSPDIRAGIALLIAALSADGTSIIHNIEQIDRGYENIDQRLAALGAKITRL
jgi:hypothetical protein